MSDTKKIYDSLAYLIDKMTRSTNFRLDFLNKEYHIIRDSDFVIMLTHQLPELDKDIDQYEISTMDSFTDRWIDLSLESLMATSGSKDYDTMWNHLNYFGITPDKVYELYSNDVFDYCPSYAQDEDFDEEE
jgi:hypothetical protein